MIFLSIGSNLISKFGDRISNIKKIIEHLNLNNVKVVKTSSYFETPSYPKKKNPKFINIVAEILWNKEPLELLNKISFIEKTLGRTRNVKNEPRICDIDIVDFKGIILKSKNLTLPHVNMENRNFVLFPLQEVCPDWKHPLNNMKIDELINNLDTKMMNEITRIL